MTKRIFVSSAILISTLLFSCKKESTPAPAPEPDPTLSAISPSEGPKNTLVTIRGTRFGTSTAALKVYFNNVQATIQTATDTAVTVLVPVNAGTGVVKLEKNGKTLTGPSFTYQGNGWVSSMTLTGAATTLNSPSGITRDPGGNLILCDRDNHRILKITPAGLTTVLAGSGIAGFTNGSGTAAQFNQPYSIVADASGNFYVSDRMNNAIRKITSAGVVTTLAGNGTGASVDGTGSAASFAEPLGIALTSTGNLYVTDYATQKIRKITMAGVVTTAITGYMAFGMVADASNVIYFTNYFQNRIYKFTEGSNTPVLVAGDLTPGTTDGTGAAARFGTPAGICVDASGNLYITETGNHLIRKITAAGVVTTIAGSVTGNSDGQGSNARFDGPIAITGDFSNNFLYVADFYNHKIRKIITE
jgi:sugar lactone lactonase YvrE